MKQLIIILSTVIIFSSCSKITYKRAVKHAPYDAIIVTGTPFDGKEWDDVMKMRIYWSYILYKKGITKNIIYSGSAVYTPYVEAEIMKQYAIKLGIPKENIFTETKAEHSTENLWYSSILANKLGFKNIALATDPFQNFAMRKFRRDKGLEMRVIPIIISEVDSYMGQKIPIINKYLAYVEDFVPIEERQSKWMRFKGTLGLNVDK